MFFHTPLFYFFCGFFRFFHSKPIFKGLSGNADGIRPPAPGEAIYNEKSLEVIR